MKRNEIIELVEICDKSLEDLRSYDSGTPYEELQIGSTLATIATPFLQGKEFEPTIKNRIRASQQLMILRSAKTLIGACSYQPGKAYSQYASHVITIRSALNELLSSFKIKSNKIFYSWQSSLPNATNRSLIHGALCLAIKNINNDVSIEERLEIDHDTLGETGSPDILKTVLRKIEECDVFIADVSLVDEKNRQCNSNVMFETGYALSVVKEEQIILVSNDAFGNVSRLPFDLNFKRAITYKSAEEDNDRSTPKTILSKKLEASIKAIYIKQISSQ